MSDYIPVGAPVTATNLTIPNLSPGKTYEVVVYAMSDSGGGPASAPVQMQTTGTPIGNTVKPGQVRNVLVSATTANSVTVTYDVPSTGGTPTGYLPEYQQGNGPWVSQTLDPDSPTIFSGLVADTLYNFRITATNAAGAGIPSVAVQQRTLATGSAPSAPLTPVNFAQGLVTATTAAFSWSPAPSGAAADSFTIEYRQAGSVTWTGAVNFTSVLGTVTGLTAATTYEFRISARNSAGPSTPSNPITLTTGTVITTTTTWNPNDKNSAITLLNGNRTASRAAVQSGAASYVLNRGDFNPGFTSGMTVAQKRDQLRSYLASLKGGKGVITGQFVGHNGDVTGPEGWSRIASIQAASGKWLGRIEGDYHFPGFTSSSAINYAYNSYAIDHWNAGGLVGLLVGTMNNPQTGGTLYDTNINAQNLITAGQASYNAWRTILDQVASGLQTLRNAGVVVLIRPLHEMNGNWFWWGTVNFSAVQFITLWQQTYTYLTQTKGLDNLLWVWSPNANVGTLMSWYPGAAYVDIVSQDFYGEDMNSLVANYNALDSSGKTVIIGEFGTGNPPANYNFDLRNLISTLKASCPNCVSFLQWWNEWSMHHYSTYVQMLNDTTTTPTATAPAAVRSTTSQISGKLYFEGTVGLTPSTGGGTTGGGTSKPSPPIITNGSATVGTWQSNNFTPEGLQYYLLLPYNYSTTYAYPVYVWLHATGGGDNPNNEANYIGTWVNTSAWRGAYPCIVIAPMLNTSGGAQDWGGASTTGISWGERNCIIAVQTVINNYSVDPTRVYLQGASLGGYGAWDQMLKYNRYNGQYGKIYTASMPMAGADYQYDQNAAAQVVISGKLPMKVFHGAVDPTVSPDWDRQTSALIGSADPNYQYIEGAGIGHWWHQWTLLEEGAGVYYDWMFGWKESNGQPVPLSTPSSTTAPTGKFKVTGGKIIAPDGKEFIGCGINVWSTDIGDKIVQFFPGINIVRFAWDYAGGSNPAYFDPLINNLTTRGIVVLIEHHVWPLTNALSGAALTSEANVFTALAQRFKSNPYVWYGSYNEPQGGDITGQQLTFYNAIRIAAGCDSIILMEAGVGGGNPNQTGPAALTTSTYASMTNIVWDEHFYAWMLQNSTDQNVSNGKLLGATGTGTGVMSLRQITSADGQIPIIVGEFGNSTDGVSVDFNWPQVKATVCDYGITNSLTKGFMAWHWDVGNNTGADQLTNGGASLTTYGQEVAQKIAQRSSGPVSTTVINQQQTSTSTWSLGLSSASASLSASVGSATQSVGVIPSATNSTAIMLNGGVLASSNWPDLSGATVGIAIDIPNRLLWATTSAMRQFDVANAGQTITDRNGVVWGINGSAQVTVGGVADTSTSNVVQLVYARGRIYQKITDGRWWSKAVPSDVWDPPAGSTTGPVQFLWNNSASANPSSGTGGVSISGMTAPPWFITFSDSNGGGSCTINPGTDAFQFPIPTSFTGWDGTQVTSAPGSVPGFQAVAQSSTVASLTWQAATNADSYAAQYKLSSGSIWTSVTPTTSLSVLVSGLTAGLSYDFRIYATNAISGNGPVSSVITVVMSAGTQVPGAPTSLRSTSASSNSITLAWNAPTTGVVANYRIYFRVSGSGSYTLGLAPVGTTGVLAGLASGTLYDIYVTAVNSAGGESGTSNVLTAPTPQATTGALRQWYMQPGSDDSYWNTPLGDGAQWSDPSHPMTQSLRHAGYINAQNYGCMNVISDANDPTITLRGQRSSDMYISGRDGLADGVFTYTVHCPNGIQSPTGERVVTFFDKTQPYKMFHFENSSLENPPGTQGGQTYDTYVIEVDDTRSTMEDQQTGMLGAQQGMGCIREWELDPSTNPSMEIQHTLRFAMGRQWQLKPPGGPSGPPGWSATNIIAPENDPYNLPYILWPRNYSDWDYGDYAGRMPVGCTIGIPISVQRPSNITSQGGIMLWNVLQRFGATWRDSGDNGVTLYADRRLENHPRLAEMRNDLAKIVPYLCVLVNQFGPSSRKGPGNRVAPYPPKLDLGQSSLAITVSAITGTSQNVAFNVSGTLTGYTSAPSLQYQDDGGVWLAMQPISVTANSFTLVHPGMAAGTHTLIVRDQNLTSVSGSVSYTTAGSVGIPLITAPLSGTVTAGTWIHGEVPASGLPSGQNFAFGILLPHNYSTNFRYPVIVYEHQNTEGNRWYQSKHNLYDDASYSARLYTWNSAAFRTRYPAIVLWPYCDQTDGSGGVNYNFGGYNDSVGNNPNLNGVIAMVRYIWNTYSCYRGKTFITGDSLGGSGTIAAMLDANQQNGPTAQIFTAGLSYSGGISLRNPDPASNSAILTRMQTVPLYCIIGNQSWTGGQDPNNFDRPVWRSYAGNSTYPNYPGAQASTKKYWYLESSSLGHNVWGDAPGGPEDHGVTNQRFRVLPDAQPYYDWLYSQETAGFDTANPTTPPPSQVTSTFTVSSGKIYDPTGKQYVARGINLGSNLSVSQVQSLFPGINHIRYHVIGYAAPSTYDAFVTAFTAQKIVVQFEDHPWPLAYPYTGSALTAQTNWYGQMAAYYKNNPYLWLGTMNEPQAANSTDMANITRQVSSTYDAIRATGNKNIVMISSGGGSGNPGQVGLNSGLIASSYSTMTNVVWSQHFYGWMTNGSQDQNVVNGILLGATNTQRGIRSIQQITSADGIIPIIIDEFGVSTSGSAEDSNAYLNTYAVTTWATIQNQYVSGFAAWDWNIDPYNALTNNGSLTTWGSWLRQKIIDTASAFP